MPDIGWLLAVPGAVIKFHMVPFGGYVFSLVDKPLISLHMTVTYFR